MFNTIESIKTERYNYISLPNTTKNCYRICINIGKMFIDKIKNPTKFISMLNLQLKMLGLKIKHLFYTALYASNET